MFNRLIKLVRQEKVSLFLGAGFSIEANAPSVNVLKKAILNEFDDGEQAAKHVDDSLADLSEYFVEDVCLGKRNALISLMHKQFDFEPKCMDDHKMMADIPHFKTIFTTNYDTLVEDSYESDKVQVVRNDNDCTYIEPDKTIVYKVHGDFTAPDSVVITSSDYENFKKHPNPLLWNKVTSEFTSKHILFIGYSLEDSNIIDIIKNISESVNRNQKEMFLIAPGLPENKINQLKKNSVHYYNAYASDFLRALSKDIADNVNEDFRHGEVSPITYFQYCHIHKYNPTVTSLENGENRIDKLTPISEQPLTHKLEMTVKSELRATLENPDFEKYGQAMDGGPFDKVPCIKLTSDQLLKCSHSVNGVVFSNNIHEVIIGPARQSMKLKCKILESDFFEILNADAYRLNDHTLLMMVDCHIYTITFTISINNNNSRTVNFRFDFKKSYSDNDQAIKWIELPIAFFSDKKISIPEIFGEPFNYTMTGEPLSNHHFSDFMTYYKNIKYIERETEKKFDRYEGCNEETFNKARALAAFLKHQYLQERNEGGHGFTFSATDIKYGDFSKQIKVNETVSIVSTENRPSIIKLNGTSFTIPYIHYIYNTCEVKNISPTEKNQLKIDFNYPEKTYYVLYSKQPVNVEFPNMKPFKELLVNK